MQPGLLLIAIFLLASLVTTTAQSAVEFSAETIESQPGQGQRKGNLYVGKDRVRSDVDLNGEKIIQIIDLGRQEAIVINVAQKSYMRRRASSLEIQSQSLSASDTSPCAGMQNLVCKELGAETVNGRNTLKWEISNPAAGQEGTIRFWLDAEHRIPVRQEMPDGSIMEQRVLGRETVNGRNTEKWEVTVRRPEGQSQASLQWYDPQIRMNVREQLPGGFTRNLINIKLQSQPADLFSIPEGYSEIAMPQQPGR
jgi:hypothetical protein